MIYIENIETSKRKLKKSLW